MPTPPSPEPTDAFLGVPWDGDALAAVLAGGIAFVTLLWTIIAFLITRYRPTPFENRTLTQQSEAASREQHHREMTDAIGFLLSKNKLSQEIGVSMLEQLRDSDWATDDDRLMVASVLNTVGEV